jgi:hypothetical protein
MSAPIQPQLDGTAVLPAAFLARWAELGGGPLEVGEVKHWRGRCWLEVTVNGVRWALCYRADPARAADDLFAMATRKPS